MPFDSERPDPAAREPATSIPGCFGSRAAMEELGGPCSLWKFCPVNPGEVYRAGKCMIDGCPRRRIDNMRTYVHTWGGHFIAPI